ncbi:hypothetical protein GCK72_021058 [Caenorhabditis remanei]|uniref:F-box domain-containing protein n=1 Tax=Caenorhabditis remanei TaxID=31234 RepID=A0A6A5GIU9_CAERE|nr:hypothetical protein GCK72_021058 [Caenorhabditis remanei]KAF1754495.1 hypothetical protein GCK72_021058 [Caenorhabditis remanei]
MAEVAERDQVVTRRRILEEFEKVQAQIAANPESWRKLSFEAHKELCNVLGEDLIDYPEFEFWFSRFARGDFELDYERSSDPKARSLIHLPLDVFENVGENLHTVDRMQLRNVCKDIRAHVDNWDPKVTEIFYSAPWDWRVWQTSRPEPYCARNFGRFENNRSSPGFHRDKMSFVMSVLAHPKLQLEKLTIDQQGVSCKKLTKRLDASNRKLHVKKVHITSSSLSPNIDLHFMIPGVLEEIKLFLKNPNRKDITKIIESEHCQAAKMVYIESDTIFPKFPRNVFYNCPRFTLRLGIYRGGGGPADKLKAQFLKRLMKKAEVQKCVIYFTEYCDPRSQILKCFDEAEAMVPNCPSLRRYPIPGTNEFYEIEHQEKDGYQEEFVCLERKQ